MITEHIKGLIFSHISVTKQSRKGWNTCNCMLCQYRGHNPDTRGRFGIRFSEDGSISVNCFNCKFGASWHPGRLLSKDFKWFLEVIGVPDYDIKKINFELYRLNANMSADGAWIETSKSVLQKWKSVDLPDGIKSFGELLAEGCDNPDFLKVAEYCINRDLCDTDSLFWSPDKSMKINKRFIIPFYYNDKVVGYTARYYKDLNTKTIPKYINVCPDSFIYNYSLQYDRNRKFVILNEGVLDGFVTQGISPLGTINQDQIDLINKLGKDIIVCADNDDDGKNLIDVALDNGWAVSFPPWRKNIKDAAKAAEMYGRIFTVHSILQTTERNKLAIKLKSQIIK